MKAHGTLAEIEGGREARLRDLLEESRLDILSTADRARRAEVECERLRGLLAIARDGLRWANADATYGYQRRVIGGALRRSDPDAIPEDGAS